VGVLHHLIAYSFETNASLPSTTANHLYFAPASGGNAARILWGDGTGYNMAFSKKNSGTETDLFTFKDNGTMQINTAALSLSDSSKNVPTTDWIKQQAYGSGTGGGYSLPSLTTGSVIFKGSVNLSQDNSNFFLRFI